MGYFLYVIRRLLLAIPTLFAVTVVAFLLVELMPGSALSVILPPVARNPETEAAVIERYALNEPIYRRYLAWLENILQGDFGRSYINNAQVSNLIKDRLIATFYLTAAAFLISVLIAFTAGILSAVYKDTWIDHVTRVFAFAGVSIPNFWLGIMMIIVLSLYSQTHLGFQIIPSGGYASPSDGIVTWLRHLLPPAVTVGTAMAALSTRLVRSSMVEVLNEQYVRTARSKGVPEKTVLLIHALRNALIPVVTVLGMQMAFLLNGAVVVEVVFQWPGVGWLLVNAATQRDVPTLQAMLLIVATFFILSNLVVDLLYAYLDPRIRYD